MEPVKSKKDNVENAKEDLKHLIKDNVEDAEKRCVEENPREENVKNCIIINNFIMKLYNKIKIK
jgi:hypothetical protein